MTAETDALRLVPVNARDLDALRYVLNRADEASRIRTVMSTFTLPERETTAERLERLYAALKAAAPAVQPAAWGEEPVEGDLIERLVEMHKLALAVWEADRDPGMGRTLALMKLGDKAERLSDTLARAMLYVGYTRPAHPPAQGSESGPTCQRCGGEIHGWCCQSCDAEFRENDAGNLVFDDDAALSQPGPASEGDP